MDQIFELITWELIVSAIATTFVVSAINTVQAKISTNWLVFIVSIVVTLLRTTIETGSIQVYQGLIFKILLTMSFAILFYNYVGKWFVDTIFVKIKEKFGR
jgi:hypothetical protein